MSEPILAVRDLRVYFELRGDGWLSKPRVLRAVDGVSFDLAQGETLGIVGESGCGKSTLARAVLGLVPVTSGEVLFGGKDLARLDAGQMREQRRHLQIIFQDPLASLDPRMTVGQIIAEPLRSFFPRMTAERAASEGRRNHGPCRPAPRTDQSLPARIFRRTGAEDRHRPRSDLAAGGGRLRRARFRLGRLDQSANRESARRTCRPRFGLSLLFIAHDLASVRHVSHRVMVLYLGKVMELAPWDEIYRAPRHPYTQALIQAIPPADPRRARSNPCQASGRRASFADHAAVGLRVPHALPVRHRALLARGARPATSGRKPGRLPSRGANSGLRVELLVSVPWADSCPI